MAAKKDFFITATILDFMVNIFPQNLRLMNTKRRLKNIGNSKSYAQKSDFDPPFLTNLLSIHVVDKNTKSLKNECKNIRKCQNCKF
jgi:hypothetical protein